MTVPQVAVHSAAQALQEEMRAWRRHLHARPELAFEEHETSDFIAAELERLGILQVRRGVGGTGVVADLRSGAGPTVALRADMDALPIEESNSFAFRSRRPGRMHACGHDAHMAMLLGAAGIIQEMFAAGSLAGGVRLIFQPAEEAADAHGRTGAARMLEEGVLEGVDLALALHVNPAEPTGVVQLADGYAMASVDTFEGVIVGRGGHGGYPEQAIDPIWLLAPVLLALHGIVSRRVSPLDTAVVTVGKVMGGSATNVIPDEVVLEGTMRAYDPQTRALLESEVGRAFSLVHSLGGDYRLRVRHESPALRNAPEVNRLFVGALSALQPPVRVQWAPFGMGGEDFAFMAAAVPAAMAFLGCCPADRAPSGLHRPDFDLDERCLPIGAALLAESVRQFLRGESPLPFGSRGGAASHA